MYGEKQKMYLNKKIITYFKYLFPSLFLLSGCLPKVAYDPYVKKVEGEWYRPAIKTSWHYQLKDDINMSYNVTHYHIDLFDSSKELIKKLKKNNKRVICYFSAGTYEDWRSDASEFPKEVLGEKLEDWDGERRLDISSIYLQKIMKKRLDLAKEKGCDGVEPDNMDVYINKSGFKLSKKEQLGYNKFIANEAHLRGLSVGLKNDLEQIKELEDFFDFAINEQCHIYEECDKLNPFIKNNKPVFNVEYDEKFVKNEAGERDKLCKKSDKLLLQTLILPLELDGSFRIECK